MQEAEHVGTQLALTGTPALGPGSGPYQVCDVEEAASW